MRQIFFLALLTAALALPHRAEALNRFVGVGTGCTNSTIQSAVDDLDNNGVAFNAIYVSRTQTYTSQDIDIDMPGQTLVIWGVNACTDVAPNGFTQISGAGGNTDPVFKIRDTDFVQMRNLRITGGDHEGRNLGGGIRFEGAGTLELQDMQISQNTAGSGGGVAMVERNASATNRAMLVIQQGVQITSNTARYDGGGIYLEGWVEMTMLRENSILQDNGAEGQPTGPGGTMEGGHGGGIYVSDRARASVGSGGLRFGAVNAIEVIQANFARLGGGVAVESKSGDVNTEFQLYQTADGFPPSLKNNFALTRGGAVWLQRKGLSNAIADIRSARMDGNEAPQGAAVYAATDFGVTIDLGSIVYINDPRRTSPFPGQVACAVGQACTRIAGNRATDPNGAIIHVENEGNARVASALISANTANRVFDLDDARDDFTSFDSLQITDNTLSGSVFVYRDMELNLRNCTVAGNSIGAASVISGSNLKMQRSIVFQPGKTAVSSQSGLELVNNIVHSGSGLTGPSSSFLPVSDPLFVDSGRSDYRLRAHAPAVDYTAPNQGGTTGDATRDAVGNPRVIDLSIVPNDMGAQDVGALERQDIGNLVLNPGFVDDPVQDLRLWQFGGDTTFSSVDRSGTAGSGSMQLSTATGITGVAGSQCIGVPGPASYDLTGFAFTSQVVGGDAAGLRWELFNDAGSCQSAPSTFGIVNIPIGGWRAPPQPAVITVSPALWTPNTTIRVSLFVNDTGSVIGGGLFGRFDDISLTVGTGGGPRPPEIFHDGFE